MGIASFFVCFSLVQNAILQAHGNETLTIISLFTGGIIKILVDWFLVGIREINIFGAPIGTFLCYMVICIMNHIFIRRNYEYKPSLKRIVPKPFVSSIVMGAAAYVTYFVLSHIIGATSFMQMFICLAISIMVAVVVYVIAVIQTKAITVEDMSLIPKGDKISKYLHLKCTNE